MPHAVTIDIQKQLAVLRMWGELTPGEVRETVQETLNDSRLAGGLLGLVDLREVTSVMALGAEDIRAAASGQLVPLSRLAIVAPDSAAFGLARMFAALRNITQTHAQIGTFRTLKEAEDWLGVAAV